MKKYLKENEAIIFPAIFVLFPLIFLSNSAIEFFAENDFKTLIGALFGLIGGTIGFLIFYALRKKENKIKVIAALLLLLVLLFFVKIIE